MSNSDSSLTPEDMDRPSLVDAMHSCEKGSSTKEDTASHNMRLLPEGYSPGEHDVLCGRGRKCFNHPGNVKFRSIVQNYLPQYSKAVAKLEKSYILSDVVDQVRNNSGVGGFVKKDPETGRWYEVGDFLAREKTSQAFRDVLHDKYKSSNTAKKKRRQEEQAEKLFRAHSSRSLGGSSLDASSVHSVGSSSTGDYMLSDSKLMRMERQNSSSIGDDLDNDDDYQAQDGIGVGGLLDNGNSSHSTSGTNSNNGGDVGARPRVFHRQRSLRSVLDFDTNRRGVFSSSDDMDGNGLYSGSSCPDLFAPSPRPLSAGPPISHIEIVRAEHGQGNRHRQRTNNNRHMMPPDSISFEVDLDSFGTQATADTATTGASATSATYNQNYLQQKKQQLPPSSLQLQQAQTWFHRSQPNLFGDAPPHNSQAAPAAGQRRQFARQPPNNLRHIPGQRHNTCVNSPNSGGLATVQQKIGNLELNDSCSNHGGLCGLDNSSSHSANAFAPQSVTSCQGAGGRGQHQHHHYSPNNGASPASSSNNNFNTRISDTDDVGDYMPHNFVQQGQTSHTAALLGDLAAAARAMGLSNNTIDHMGLNGSGVAAGSGSVDMGRGRGGPGLDVDLMARLAALANNNHGMDVIDENPFEPVPLREG